MSSDRNCYFFGVSANFFTLMVKALDMVVSTFFHIQTCIFLILVGLKCLPILFVHAFLAKTENSETQNDLLGGGGHLLLLGFP